MGVAGRPALAHLALPSGVLIMDAYFREERHQLSDGRIVTERLFATPSIPATAVELLAAIDGLSEPAIGGPMDDEEED